MNQEHPPSQTMETFQSEMDDWDSHFTEEMLPFLEELQNMLRNIEGVEVGGNEEKLVIVKIINSALDAMHVCIVCPKKKCAGKLDVEKNEYHGLFRLRESRDGKKVSLSRSQKLFKTMNLASSLRSKPPKKETEPLST